MTLKPVANHQNDDSMETENCSETGAQEYPEHIKRRIYALKNIQAKTVQHEAEFYKELHVLECKYLEKFSQGYKERRNIVVGDHVPTAEECVPVGWKLDEDEEISKNISEMKIDSTTSEEESKGIPEFWLTVFKNVTIIAEMIKECDEPILKHLTDVTYVMSTDPMGFTLMFYFSPNEFFTNPMLTKVYEMRCTPDEDDPFSFEGPEIVTCKGCKINWLPGKDITVRTIKKKQKPKGSRANQPARVITKTVKSDSFFHFFSPPESPTDSDSEEFEEIQALLTTDFEIGHIFRENVIPRAILYFTGEAVDEEDEEDYEEYEDEVDEDEDDDDQDESESDEENEGEARAKGDGARKRSAPKGAGRVAPSARAAQENCNQQ